MPKTYRWRRDEGEVALIIVVIDWPERAVPEGLARGGHEVWVKGGPGDDDFARWAVSGDEVIAGEAGPAPDHADMVYVFRPLGEMPAAVGLAKRLGAGTVWHQSGRNAAGDRDPKGCALSPGEAERLERLVAATGMRLVWDRYVLEG